jgi:predicted Zn-dependent peptidase
MKRIGRGELDNGLKFYTLEDENIHLSGVGVMSGSFNDPQNMQGLAHFVEHMISRGPRWMEVREASRLFRKYGCHHEGGIDVHTTYYDTFYGTGLMLRRRYSQQLFEVFAGMINNSILSLEGRGVELGAVKTEYLLHGEDDNKDILRRSLYDLVYRTNPALKRVDCQWEQLEKVNLNHVRAFIRNYYVPNNMFVIFLGPTHRAVRSLVENHFGHLKERPVPKLDYDGSDDYPRLAGIKSRLIEKNGVCTTHAILGFPLPPFAPGNFTRKREEEMVKDRIALDVLVEILESRLHTQIRERLKSTYHPEVYIDDSQHHGMLCLWFPTYSESRAYEGIEAIIEDIENIKRGGINSREFQKALHKAPRKKGSNGNAARKHHRLLGIDIPEEVSISYARGLQQSARINLHKDISMGVGSLRTRYYEGMETMPSNLVKDITQAICGGDTRVKYVNKYIDYLNKVGIKRVRDVANKYLTTPDKLAIVVMKPVPETQELNLTNNFYEEASNQRKLF